MNLARDSESLSIAVFHQKPTNSRVMTSTNEFPILDFSRFNTDFEGFANDIFAASNKWGFFVLTGHGVPGVGSMYDLVS